MSKSDHFYATQEVLDILEEKCGKTKGAKSEFICQAIIDKYVSELNLPKKNQMIAQIPPTKPQGKKVVLI